MPKGSCLCGEVKYEYEGEPVAKAACHCIPCRKTSGTTNSYNLMIPSDKYKMTSGSLRSFARKGDSGKTVTYNYCQDCPTVLFVTAEAMAGINIVKMGTLDDEEVFEKLGNASLEIYTKNRPSWCEQISGAQQKEAS